MKKQKEEEEILDEDIWARLGSGGYQKINEAVLKVVLYAVALYILQDKRTVLSDGVYSLTSFTSRLNDGYIEDIISIDTSKGETCPSGYSDFEPTVVERSIEGCRCKYIAEYGNETDSGKRRRNLESLEQFYNDFKNFTIAIGFLEETLKSYGFTEEEIEKYGAKWAEKAQEITSLHSEYYSSITDWTNETEVQEATENYYTAVYDLYSDNENFTLSDTDEFYSGIYYSDEGIRTILGDEDLSLSDLFVHEWVHPLDYEYYFREGSDYDFQGNCKNWNLSSSFSFQSLNSLEFEGNS